MKYHCRWSNGYSRAVEFTATLDHLHQPLMDALRAFHSLAHQRVKQGKRGIYIYQRGHLQVKHPRYLHWCIGHNGGYLYTPQQTRVYPRDAIEWQMEALVDFSVEDMLFRDHEHLFRAYIRDIYEETENWCQFMEGFKRSIRQITREENDRA